MSHSKKTSRLYSYSFPHALDVRKIKDQLSEQYQISEIAGVLHLVLPENQSDAFVFPFGAIVCWGFNEDSEVELCRHLAAFSEQSLGAEDVDLFSFSYAEKASFNSDEVQLPGQDPIYKFACSYALAQSVKLGGFEELVQNTVEKTKKLPAQLAKDGTIHLNKKEMSRLMGQLFLDRSAINLHMEFLDMPDYFWYHPEYEPLHVMIARYVDIDDRIEVLNQKLGVMQELTHMLAGELNSQHSSKLEWIIIILIAVEVVITFTKDVFHII